MRFLRTQRFKEAYLRLDQVTAARANKALALLAANPRHPSLRLKKVRSSQNVWEAQVDRDHRMTLHIEKDCYVMRKIGKHDDVLGSP